MFFLLFTKGKAKGGLISESFSVWLQSPKKKGPNQESEHLLYRWIYKCFKVVIWHPFLEIRAKVKNFFRLSNLQHINLDKKVDKS